MSSYSCPYDPFKKARTENGIHPGNFKGEQIPMILRFKDVREAAKDWEQFSSDTPYRVPIPSEEEVRNYRQLPIETNPPEHTDYRALVEPLFKRPAAPEFIARIEALIGELLDGALASADPVEVVNGFALPLQCKALTLLLGVSAAEAEVWLGWGMNVFIGEDREEKGKQLERYLARKFDEAAAAPAADDFFSILAHADFKGRKLTKDEMMGFGNLAFAGGRDTVINMVAAVIGYVAEHPETIAKVRANPKLILTATEEFARVVSPVSHIGRTCPHGATVAGHEVKPGQRVALTWGAANFDETVFEAPQEVRLDRKPNPHVAYGFGAHTCIGATHARTIIRSLLKVVAQKLERIELVSCTQNCEAGPNLDRHAPYDTLHVRLVRRAG